MIAIDEQISAIREMGKDSNGKSKEKRLHEQPVRSPGSIVIQAESRKMKIFLPSQVKKGWEKVLRKGKHELSTEARKHHSKFWELCVVSYFQNKCQGGRQGIDYYIQC